jgi:hypothetical protein
MAVINKVQCLTLVADLWVDKYPLVRKYFGKYLSQLIRAALDKPYEGRFINAAFFPEELENRLREIEHTDQTEYIMSEVRNIQDPVEIDRRLMDAWAELRTISQIVKEGFTEVAKVKATADLTAKRQEHVYAFQVKRINSSLDMRVEQHNEPDERDSTPEGALSDIYERLGEPVSYFFWDALREKNAKFKKWDETNWIRCIVIVSGDEDLQDPLVRHIACKKIREGIHYLSQRHFEELLWLPDTGNGAWFKIGYSREETRCFADWKDELGNPDSKEDVNRREIHLDEPFY